MVKARFFPVYQRVKAISQYSTKAVPGNCRARMRENIKKKKNEKVSIYMRN